MLVNLTLRNFAAGKPSVNDRVFATTSSLPPSYFMVVEEMSIENTFHFLKQLTMSNQHVVSTQQLHIVLLSVCYHIGLQREQT